MRSGDHDAADGVQISHGVRNDRRRRIRLGQVDREPIGSQHTGGLGRITIRKEAGIEPHHHHFRVRLVIGG